MVCYCSYFTPISTMAPSSSDIGSPKKWWAKNPMNKFSPEFVLVWIPWLVTVRICYHIWKQKRKEKQSGYLGQLTGLENLWPGIEQECQRWYRDTKILSAEKVSKIGLGNNSKVDLGVWGAEELLALLGLLALLLLLSLFVLLALLLLRTLQVLRVLHALHTLLVSLVLLDYLKILNLKKTSPTAPTHWPKWDRNKMPENS